MPFENNDKLKTISVCANIYVRLSCTLLWVWWPCSTPHYSTMSHKNTIYMFLNSSDETRRRKVSMHHVSWAGMHESCIYLQIFAFFKKLPPKKWRSLTHINILKKTNTACNYSPTSSWVLSKNRPTSEELGIHGYMQPLPRQCYHVRTPPLSAFLTGEENGRRSVVRPVLSMRANEIDS